MSITVIRSVHCDRCHSWVENGLGTAAEVRAFAKRCGWKVGLPGGEDLCDECAAVPSARPETTGDNGQVATTVPELAECQRTGTCCMTCYADFGGCCTHDPRAPWPGIKRGGIQYPRPTPAPPAIEGACPHCGALGGLHLFRNCEGQEATE